MLLCVIRCFYSMESLPLMLMLLTTAVPTLAPKLTLVATFTLLTKMTKVPEDPANARWCFTLSALTPPVTVHPWLNGGREIIPPALAEACPRDRWVGYILRGNAACPPAMHPDWHVSKLFGGTTLAAPDLGRFCLYDWTGAGAPLVGALLRLGHRRGAVIVE